MMNKFGRGEGWGLQGRGRAWLSFGAIHSVYLCKLKKEACDRGWGSYGGVARADVMTCSYAFRSCREHSFHRHGGLLHYTLICH